MFLFRNVLRCQRLYIHFVGWGRVGLTFCLESDSVIIILSVERFDEAAIKCILDNVVALLEVDEPEGKAKVLMLIAEIAKSGNSERNKSS